MELDAISVFVKVVQAGSFTSAARQLQMPNTTVSAKVAALEKRLGATLIHRTTRKLSVTQAGEAYFRRCVRALEEIQAAESEVASSQVEVRGQLRITAPVDVGHTLLPPLVQRFSRKYPQVELDLLVTNRVVDLVGEGIDVGIRAGELEDSTLICRRFVSSHMEFFASPTYLKKNGTPTTPKELERHEFLRFTPLNPDHIEIQSGKNTATIRPRSRLQADDLETLRIFAVMGEGIAALPRFLCEEELKRERLVSILPRWQCGSGHFSLVYPEQKFVSPKLRAFLETAGTP